MNTYLENIIKKLKKLKGNIIAKFNYNKHEIVRVKIFFSSLFIVLFFIFFITALSYADVRSMQIYNEELQSTALYLNKLINLSHPEESYENFRTALLENNLDEALYYIHPSYLDDFKQYLRDVYEQNNLPKLAQIMTPAKYEIRRDENASRLVLEPISENLDEDVKALKVFGESVELSRDKYNVWKIRSVKRLKNNPL